MMAKAPKTTKTAKPKAGIATKPKAARKPAAPKKAKKEEPAPEPVFHNGTRLFFNDDAGRQAIEEILPLIDAVSALDRVLITSVSAPSSKLDILDIHAVKPGHPEPYSQFPGIILTLDMDDSSVAFDHHIIGFISADLIDDAAFSLLGVIQGDAPGLRRPDWYALAEATVDEVAGRHTRSLAEIIAETQAKYHFDPKISEYYSC